MPASPIITPPSPLPNSKNEELSSEDRLTGSPPEASTQSPAVAAANKIEPNPPKELLEEHSTVPSSAIKKTILKSKIKQKPKPTEEITRRRSTRVSTVPDRFQPEGKTRKHLSPPSANPRDEPPPTLQNTPVITPTVTPTGDSKGTESVFAITPTPMARIVSSSKFARKIASPATVEASIPGSDPSKPSELMEIDKEEGSPASGSTEKGSTEVALLTGDRDVLPLEIGKQDIPERGSTEKNTARVARPKRSQKKKTPPKKGLGIPSKRARKPTTPAEETTEEVETTPMGETMSEATTNTAPAQLNEGPTRSRKRPVSEEPDIGKRSNKKSKPEDPKRRKPLAVEPTARKTRSQIASASAELVSASTESPAPGVPIAGGQIIETPTPKVTTTPRLSTMVFREPLRAMIRSATLHYNTLPTNLTDRFAIASLYRTFFASDMYRKHLKVLGLEGDDEDVRECMRQVWQKVDIGEKDDEAVWRMLHATWSSQGARGWGNDGKMS